MSKIYGWFDDAGQASPTYDPPHDSDCPYCGLPITSGDVRTHSIMWQDNAERSYFYRTHRTCDQRSRSNNMDALIFDMIERDERGAQL